MTFPLPRCVLAIHGEKKPSCIADDADRRFSWAKETAEWYWETFWVNSWSWTLGSFYPMPLGRAMLTLELARMRKVAESRHQFCAHLAWYFHLCPTLPTLLNEKKHPAGPFAAHLPSEDMNFMIKNVHLLDGIIPLIIPLLSHYITLKLCLLNPFDVSILYPFTALWILWISNVNICIIPFEGHMALIFH